MWLDLQGGGRGGLTALADLRQGKAGWGWGALTIEAHIMVGKDGWAVPLGGTPDHHMQKAVRRFDVMLLEGERALDTLGSPYSRLLCRKRLGGSRELWAVVRPPCPTGAGRPILVTPGSPQRTEQPEHPLPGDNVH